MKKLIPFFLLLLILAACGSENEDPTPEPEELSKLVGTWTVVSSQSELFIGDLTYKEYLMSFGFTEEEAQMASDELEEMSTLTGFYAEMEFKKDRSWSGDSEFVETATTGTWELDADGKILTLTNNDQPGAKQVATLSKLNDTDLWMEITLSGDQLPPGYPEQFKYLATIKMTRKK